MLLLRWSRTSVLVDSSCWASSASALFAAIPYIVPKGGSVAVVIGLVAQTGGIGTVFGPPLAAHVIERYGWTGYAWFLAITGIVGALLVVPLLMPRRTR